MINSTKMLETIKSASIFSQVGKELDMNYTRVNSWEYAYDFCCRQSSDEFSNESSNHLSRAVSNANPKRFDLWNDHVTRFKEVVCPITEKSIQNISLDEEKKKVIKASLQWDLLSILLESEYADIVFIRTYHAIASIYLKGHFVCGWDGEVPFDENDCPLPWGGDFPPNGRLAIF